MNREAVINLMKEVFPEKEITGEALDKFTKSLKELSPKEEAVITLRYGLDDGEEACVEEVADTYEVTREKILEVIDGVFKKLRHPARQ